MTEENRIVQHLLRHKDIAKSIISISYPFSDAELSRYANKLEWEWISMNSNIPWNESLFNEFESKIIIGAFAGNKSFPWTEEFIDKHIMELFYTIDFESVVQKSTFADNPGLPWSDKFIEKYGEHWDWQCLSTNDSIPFTIELIDKYKDKWDFDALEFNSKIVKNPLLRNYLNKSYNCNAQEKIHKCEFCFKSEEIFEEYNGQPVSTDLFRCPNFKWTTEFASKLRSKLTGENDDQKVVRAILIQPFNHWSIELLDSFEDLWNYEIFDFPDELTDYLAFAIKRSNQLNEIMKEL